MLVVDAGDLVLLFVGLELISIPTYVLLYLGRRDAQCQEVDGQVLLPERALVGNSVVRVQFSLRGRPARPTSLPCESRWPTPRPCRRDSRPSRRWRWH